MHLLPLLLLLGATPNELQPTCFDAQGFSGRMVNGKAVEDPKQMKTFPAILCTKTKSKGGPLVFTITARKKDGGRTVFESPALTEFSGDENDQTVSAPIDESGARWKLRMKPESLAGCFYDPLGGVFMCAVMSAEEPAKAGATSASRKP